MAFELQPQDWEEKELAQYMFLHYRKRCTSRALIRGALYGAWTACSVLVLVMAILHKRAAPSNMQPKIHVQR